MRGSEFPMYLTSAKGERKLVSSKAEAEALGAGWFKNRADAKQEAPKPIIATLIPKENAPQASKKQEAPKPPK